MQPNILKCTLRDDGIGVFLMIRGPRGSAWRGGRIIDALVSQIDVFPTLCEWSNATPPAWLQGHSLTPLVTEASGTIRDEIQAAINYTRRTSPPAPFAPPAGSTSAGSTNVASPFHRTSRPATAATSGRSTTGSAGTRLK